MNISPYWDEAHYCCADCGKTIKEEDLKVVKLHTRWKCPSCGGNLYVYASTKNWNYTLIRKHADEIERGDLILFLGTMKTHEVLNVEEKDGTIRIALKGHGVIKTTEEQWVDIVRGSWQKGTTPWNRVL